MSLEISDSAAKHVRLSFNVDGDPTVTRLKSLTAAFITECEKLRDAGLGPREAALAITEAQKATYFAVMAATTNK